MVVLRMEGFDTDRIPEGFGMYQGREYDLGSIYLAFANGRNVGRGLVVDHAEKNAGYWARDRGVFENFDPKTSMTWSTALYMRAGAQIIGTSWWPRESKFMSLMDSNGYGYAELHLIDPGVIELRVNGVTVGSTNVAVLSPDVWIHLSMSLDVHETNGKVGFQVNGVPVAQVSGINTKNAGNGEITRALFNFYKGDGSGVRAPNHRYVLDDWIRLDHTGPWPLNGPLGDCRVTTVRPNGVGSISEWIGSDGNSVDNWQLIDDNATTSDYIRSPINSPGAKDLSTITSTTFFDKETVYAAQADMLISKSEAGVPLGVDAILRSPSGDEVSARIAEPIQLSITPQWFSSLIFSTPPHGGDWTVDGFNNIQVGVSVAHPDEESL